MPEMTAGERVRRWRELKGWSIRELARRAGLQKSRLHRLETKPEADPRAAELEQISDALGISMPEFFGGSRETGT